MYIEFLLIFILSFDGLHITLGWVTIPFTIFAVIVFTNFTLNTMIQYLALGAMIKHQRRDC